MSDGNSVPPKSFAKFADLVEARDNYAMLLSEVPDEAIDKNLGAAYR